MKILFEANVSVSVDFYVDFHLFRHYNRFQRMDNEFDNERKTSPMNDLEEPVHLSEAHNDETNTNMTLVYHLVMISILMGANSALNTNGVLLLYDSQKW